MVRATGPSTSALRPTSQLVNAVLQPFGLRLQRLRTVRETEARARLFETLPEMSVFTAGDLIACASEFLFPQLPPVENRDKLILQLAGTAPIEALYLADCIHRGREVEGDVCEFGVGAGATSAFMANELRVCAKKLWLFDSFEGLPQPTAKDVMLDDVLSLGAMDSYTGQMSYSMNQVKLRLTSSGFDPNSFEFVPGFFEQTRLRADLPTRISFAYIDFDFYEPISMALEFVADRMPPMGSMVIDDYGHFSSGAKTAVDEFIAKRRLEFELRLPIQFSKAGKSFEAFAIVQRVC